MFFSLLISSNGFAIISNDEILWLLCFFFEYYSTKEHTFQSAKSTKICFDRNRLTLYCEYDKIKKIIDSRKAVKWHIVHSVM